MKLIDFTTTSNDEIAPLIRELSPMQIRANAEQLSEAQIEPAVHVLIEAHDTEWREKIVELVLGLTSRSKIEVVGRSLSLDQAVQLLLHPSLNKKNTREELTAILVGMPHHLFLQLLLADQNAVLNVLKQEVNTEAVQHHLAVLAHEQVNNISEVEKRYLDFYHKLVGLTVTDLGRDDIYGLTHEIDEINTFLNSTLTQISKLLQLAWNTERTDIIDLLSTTKEVAVRLRNSVIGLPRTYKKLPSGLYLQLEEQLFSVYGNSDNPTDIEAIKDDEPAIEALVKLSLWYVHDYWEIGLLPHIKTEQEVAFLPKDHRDKLIATAQQNLAKMSLHTAADLKAARIFSKKSLQEFIAKQSHKL